MKGLVYRSTGSWYDVLDDTGKKWKARLKGVMRIDNITSTNPIAVGDWVELEPDDKEEDIASVAEIFDRDNYITRQSPHNKHARHIVASNLDQTMLVATLKDPRTSQGFIDRFLVASETNHIPAVIVFNKSDIWRKKEEALFEAYNSMYSSAGYQVLAISVQNGSGLDALKSLLENKITLVSGHSGVGKSSLLNTMLPGKQQHTQEVSSWSGKGMHTTTFAEMFQLPMNGKVIDTPGVKEFGLLDVSRQDLSHYFPEMLPLLNDCQFNNCLHINEPGCAVKAALYDPETDEKKHQSNRVYIDRYVSYLTILESLPASNRK